jgi:hypothetical protein
MIFYQNGMNDIRIFVLENATSPLWHSSADMRLHVHACAADCFFPDRQQFGNGKRCAFQRVRIMILRRALHATIACL